MNPWNSKKSHRFGCSMAPWLFAYVAPSFQIAASGHSQLPGPGFITTTGVFLQSQSGSAELKSHTKRLRKASCHPKHRNKRQPQPTFVNHTLKISSSSLHFIHFSRLFDGILCVHTVRIAPVHSLVPWDARFLHLSRIRKNSGWLDGFGGPLDIVLQIGGNGQHWTTSPEKT